MAIKSILGGKSKNLCDVAYLLTLPIDTQFSNYGFWEVEVDVEPNTTYTLSRENSDLINLGATTYLGLSNEYTNPSPDDAHHRWLNHQVVPDRCRKSVTLTSNADGKLWIFFSSPVYTKWQKNLNPFGYIQIEKGSTATEYVPYELTSYKSIMKVSDVCQLIDKSSIPTTRTVSGVTFTNNEDGSVTVNGTSTHQYYSEIAITIDDSLFIPGHVYLNGTASGEFAGFVALYGKVAKDWLIGPQTIRTLPSGKDFTKFRYIIRVGKGKTANNYICTPQLFDLTEMFGAGNEPKTVAEFKAKFPNDYYPYSPSCFVTSFDERMPCKTKNLFDINAEMHDAKKPKYYIEVIGNIVKTNYDISHVKHPYIEVPVEIGETYTFSCKAQRSANTINIFSRVRYPDNTVVTYISNGTTTKTFTATQSSIQVCFGIDTEGKQDTSQFELMYDIQLEKGSTATDYVPYDYV